MSQAALTVIHCSEDALAGHIAEHFFDRANAESDIDNWIRDDLWPPATRASARLFVDFAGRAGRANRTDVKNQSGRLRVHLRGLSGNAALAYKCYRLASLLEIDGDRLLLLSFDTDRKSEEQRCSKGVQRAREESTSNSMPCVIAEASPEFDAWVLAGFVACNERERDLLASTRAELGFDPVSAPHLLTSTMDSDPRDAKQICKRLLQLPEQAGPEHERVLACLNASLSTLRQNGAQAGLDDFLRSAESEVFALLGGEPRAESA